MNKGITQFAVLAGLVVATQALSDTGPDTALAAKAAYLAAINSNDAARFLETVTEDIVFIAPGTPMMEGKAEVAPWVSGYFDAVQTFWSKQSLEFVVADEWAFERYVFTATDTPYGWGTTTVSKGYGINLYHRDPDGVWRVARDIWSHADPDDVHASLSPALTCGDFNGPC